MVFGYLSNIRCHYTTNVMNDPIMRLCLQRILQSCTKQDVSHILVKRLGDSVTVICRKGGSDASDQLLLLFFWAILRHNLDLAKLFWEEGKVGDMYFVAKCGKTYGMKQ